MRDSFPRRLQYSLNISPLSITGVGKTSLTHLICQQQPISNPSWTIGCSVEVKLHEYKEGTPNQRRYFIELWDIGGSQNHQNTRSVFYNPTNGKDLEIFKRYREHSSGN